MLRIALTGGIASGKSAASARLGELGVPIVDTDVISRQLVEPGKPALAELAQAFGNDILLADDSLNRLLLRERVFADPAQRSRLEDILHPLIHAATMASLDALPGPYQVMVIPLLAGSRHNYPYDRVLLIDSPEELQRIRLARRDGSSPEQIEQILVAQSNRESRQKIANDIILNDGSLSDLRAAVDRQHQKYLKLSQG